MESAPFAELVADVKKNGLREKITLYGGKILDGCNRYRACCEAGIDPGFMIEVGDGRIDDPVAYVISKNIHRRHLNAEDRQTDDASRPMGGTQGKFRNGIRVLVWDRSHKGLTTTIDRISWEKAPTPTLTAIDKPVSATPDPTPPDTEKEASMAKPHIVAESDKLPDSFAPITESKPEVEIADAPMSIAKPAAFDLDKFKSKRAAAIANVETLLGALPHHNMAAAKDFVRLHPDEDKYWSDELCFVNVPTKRQKRDTLHLIVEDLALRYVPSGRVQRFRFALATKPHDVFFLCQVPTRNLDNSWNKDNQRGCEVAKTLWVQATSRKDEGVESYKIDPARDPDAFPPPKWPTQSLDELIEVTFAGRMIDTEDHPALLRLIGAKQKIT
jgi:hypothetical protein